MQKIRIGPASSPEGAKRSGAAALARCAELGRFVQRSVGLWPLDDAGPIWPRAEMRACRRREAERRAASPHFATRASLISVSSFSLVVGAGGAAGASASFFRRRLITWMTRNKAAAMIRKLMTLVTKLP